MGISYKSGNSANATASSSASITYSATAGNILWLFLGLSGSPGGAVAVEDGNSVSMNSVTNANNTQYIYAFQYTVPAGGNGGAFSVTWPAIRQNSITVMEYSVTGGTMSVSATNTATNSGSTSDPTISLTIGTANDFIVVGFVGPGTTETSWSAGNERKNTTAGTSRVSSGDNTSATAITSVTCTGGVSLATWSAVAGEIIFTPSSTALPGSLMMMGVGI